MKKLLLLMYAPFLFCNEHGFNPYTTLRRGLVSSKLFHEPAAQRALNLVVKEATNNNRYAITWSAAVIGATCSDYIGGREFKRQLSSAIDYSEVHPAVLIVKLLQRANKCPIEGDPVEIASLKLQALRSASSLASTANTNNLLTFACIGSALCVAGFCSALPVVPAGVTIHPVIAASPLVPFAVAGCVKCQEDSFESDCSGFVSAMKDALREDPDFIAEPMTLLEQQGDLAGLLRDIYKSSIAKLSGLQCHVNHLKITQQVESTQRIKRD